MIIVRGLGKEHFNWLLAQIVPRQVSRRVLHRTTLSIYFLQRCRNRCDNWNLSSCNQLLASHVHFRICLVCNTALENLRMFSWPLNTPLSKFYALSHRAGTTQDFTSLCWTTLKAGTEWRKLTPNPKRQRSADKIDDGRSWAV